MVEVMKIMATSQCPQPCSRRLLTHASPGDSCTLMGMSRSVSCGVIAPLFWVLVRTSFCLCQSYVKFWWWYGGVNGDLLQEGLSHTKVHCSQIPCTTAVHCWPIPLQEILKHSSVSVSVESLGPGAHKVCLSPLSISGEYGVLLQMWFCPSYHLARASLSLDWVTLGQTIKSAENWIKDLLSMALSTRVRPSFPHSQSFLSGS